MGQGMADADGRGDERALRHQQVRAYLGDHERRQGVLRPRPRRLRLRLHLPPRRRLGRQDGVGVATVTLGSAGPTNAALLAVQILGTADAELREKFRQYKQGLRQKVLDGDKKVNG